MANAVGTSPPVDEGAKSPHIGGLTPWYRLGAEAIALVYIAVIAQFACATGAFYVLFPELGALSQDVFTRPRGTWARSPILLALTPVLTAVVGIAVTRELPYGLLSVLVIVAASIAIIETLRSPVAPAISAGLLPLVLGLKSWWYPPGILLGTTLLALLLLPWKAFCAAGDGTPTTAEDVVEDVIELAPRGYRWLIALLSFVAVAVLAVDLTGLRFILFPPLVVIGFEMLGHTAICSWAKRPLALPIACFLTAAGGLLFWRLFGVSALAAAASMAWGILILRAFDLHIPPALAIALLPMVMNSPTAAYPLSVGIGTLLMTLWFIAYQRFACTESAASVVVSAHSEGGVNPTATADP
jgi:hypothetical protein